MADKKSKEKCLGQMEIMAEIKLAKKEERPADFSNRNIADLSLVFDHFKYGLNLENAVIFGPVFLSEISVSGDLNLRGAKIKGSLYLARSEIKDDLILEDARIGGAVNLVGAKIGGSFLAGNLSNSGFLSLAKSEIKKDAILEKAEVRNADYGDMSVRGDLFLDSSSIGGKLSLDRISIDGRLDFEGAEIKGDLVISEAKIRKDQTDTTRAKIGGRKII